MYVLPGVFRAGVGACASLVVSGCAGSILLDSVEGRTHLASSPIPSLARQVPGSVAVGLGGALQKPEDLHLRAPQGMAAASGRQDWELPRWNASAFLAWTPWEGVSVLPEGVLGLDGQGVTGGGSLGLLLHTGVDGFAWGLEGRLGASWARSRIGSRAEVFDVTRAPEPFADSLRWGGLATLAPWASLGLHLESRVKRSPWQLWGLGRFALQNPSLLDDRTGEQVALVGLQVWQAGAGIHRSVGERHVLSAGVVHSVVAPTWRARTDQSSRLLVQWRADLGSSD